MPDRNGNFKGISVPALPWEKTGDLKQRVEERIKVDKPVLDRLAKGADYQEWERGRNESISPHLKAHRELQETAIRHRWAGSE